MPRYGLPFILVFILLGLTARAQEDTAWVRYYSSGEEPVMGHATTTVGTDVYTLGNIHDATQQFFVAKYDAVGDSLWARTYAFENAQTAIAIRADGEANLLVAVSVEDDPQLLMLVKLDPSGDTLWVRRELGLMPSALAVGPDNSVYVWSNSGHPMPFDTLALLKFSADGTRLWSRRYRFGMFNRSAGCAWVHDGLIALAAVDEGGGMQQKALRFDAQGETAWTRNFDELGMAEPAAVVPAPEGDFYLTATEGSMLKLVRCDSDGEIVWMLDHTSQSMPEIYGNLATDAFGNAYIATQSPAMHIGFLCVNPEGEELYQLETDIRAEVMAVAVDEQNQPIAVGTFMEGHHRAITVKFAWSPGIASPAPVHTPVARLGTTIVRHRELRLAIPRAGRWEIKLYGLDGRIAAGLYSGQLPAGDHRFRVDGLASGVYVLTATDESGRLTAKVLLPE